MDKIIPEELKQMIDIESGLVHQHLNPRLVPSTGAMILLGWKKGDLKPGC
jgi:hypothetical protein